MLSKLAIGNVKKSFKDYTIYFLTLVFAVCIFYMFNSIESQRELMEATKTKNEAMELLVAILSYMSMFVSVVLGFLIVYANNFLIRRRKKELGIYMTLGMEKSSISLILILETLFIGIFALIVGLIAGIFLSQIMSIFTAKMFEADMTSYKFIFSLKASMKAILYFGIIFLVVMVFNFISVSKGKLIDLLYAENKNETFKTKNIFMSLILFVLSVISLGISYYLILTNGMLDLNRYFTFSIVFGVIGTLLFFMSLSGFILKFVQNNKGLYFRKLNIFILRQLNSKINTNYISMSVICIVLLFSIGTLSSGMSLNNVLSQTLKKGTPFDNSFFLYRDTGKNIYEGIDKEYPLGDKVKEYEQYNIYKAEQTYDKILSPDYKDSNYEIMGNEKIDVISISDYNNILKMQGKEPITLDKDEYAISCSSKEILDLLKYTIENDINISINGKTLKLGIKDVLETTFDNNVIASNMGTVIVNDKLIDGLYLDSSVLNINYKDTVDPVEIDEAMDKINKKYYEEDNKQEAPFLFYISKLATYTQAVSTKTIVTFIAIYLGLVFLVACVAILALQQLSEAADNKKRYDLLRKIGTERSMINSALFTQIFIYFLMPLSLAIVHSIVGLSAVNDVIKIFGKVDLWHSILATTGFFVVIYGGYFIATYFGCKNIIIKN
ncbi:FtsX-like permease family protein [Clostridiisalibacter paucivorans]|uniref:FtsX-like permease family protein n=1 Tax=Clostridiisalibacter paucivorans TaxID=408753 RepID=UPI00047A8D9C|nr:ABC transporter permease [Clostridiisalibacter paucivorans]